MAGERADVGYQPVVCMDCEREYVCTPTDDYYDFTTTTDGCCFQCLLKRNGLRTADPTVTM